MSSSRGQPPGYAFVLHQWDWSETSLILDLFTREQGRVAAVAKGAKRPYSQLRSVLLPFQRLHVQLGRGKDEEGSEIVTLRSAEYAHQGSVLPSDLLLTGFYLNELLQKLLARGDPHARLFDAYADALQALALDDDEATLRAFELVLLQETGVLPALDLDAVRQTPLQPEQGYLLRAETGLVRAAADEPLPLRGEHGLALAAALQAGHGAALRLACRDSGAALKAQLRPLLHYHLGTPQLRTRQTLLAVRRLVDAAPSPSTDLP